MNTKLLQFSFSCLAVLALLVACGGGGGNESGSAGTVQLAQTSFDTNEGAIVNIFVEDFTEISVLSLSRVTVSQGPEYSVRVTAGADVLDDLQVTRSGDMVSIGLSNNQIFSAVITMPVRNRIEVDPNALAYVSIEDFDQAQMTIDLGGVSTMLGEGLQIGELDASVSGVSLLDLGDTRP